MKNSTSSLKEKAIKELATRELEKRHESKREDLLEYMDFMFKENNKVFDQNWHHKLIADKLNKVLTGEITRLMINIPPGHMKTELITKCFTTWALGNNPTLEICATGYSTQLTQTYSGEARDYYTSKAYKTVFPRRSELREDQNTKEWWKNTEGGSYYATGTGGSITGRRFRVFIIDDPLKPDEAESDIKRIGVNNWYSNTVLSRLYDPLKDAVIIIMQRTHEDDLCGHLLSKMQEGSGENWEVVSLPAIAVQDDEFRKEGEALHVKRYPVESLKTLQKSLGDVNFSTQYQQDPMAKESQEFHEEWFKYIFRDQVPRGRTFTTIDPAFSKAKDACDTGIITGKFNNDSLYVWDISQGKYSGAELEDEALIHARKHEPEKIGVEAYGAQINIGPSLRNRFATNRVLRTTVESITQKGDKDFKIRRLIPLYRNGLIYHVVDRDKDGNAVKSEPLKQLEAQLTKFPRGRLKDLPDTLQMLYEMYELQPNIRGRHSVPQIKYDSMGRPSLT